MAFFYLDDGAGTIEVVCFSKVYAEAEATMKANEPLLIKGTVVFEGEGDVKIPKVHAKEMHLLSDWRLRKTSRLLLECTLSDLTDEKLKKMEAILKQFPGGIPVKIRVKHPGNWRYDAELPIRYRTLPKEELIALLENICGKNNVVLM